MRAKKYHTTYIWTINITNWEVNREWLRKQKLKIFPLICVNMNTAHRQIPASLCFRIILVPDKWPCDTNPEKVKKHHNHVGQTKEEEDDDDANFIGEGTSWLANIFQSPSILLMHTLAHTCHTIILHFMMQPLALEELFDNSYLLPNKFHPSYLSFVPTWVISPYWAVLGLSFFFFLVGAENCWRWQAWRSHTPI